MNAFYEPLFELTCENNYFANNEAKNIQLVIDSESQKILKNYQLLFKPRGGKNLVLFNKNNKKLNIPQIWKGKTTKLSFFILNNDYQFFNYTQLSQTTDFHYYNNEEIEDEDGQKIFKASIVKIRPLVFDYNLEPGEENKAYKIIDNFNNPVLEGKTQTGSLLIDLRGEPESRYRLLIKEESKPGFEEKLGFYTYPGLQQHYFGVIEIYLNSVQEMPKYVLQFLRRSTFWQYHIGYPKGKDWKFSIQPKKGEKEISFCRGDVVEKNDRKWISFTSKKKIPFTESGVYSFELEIDRGELEAKIKMDLPNPNVEILGRMLENPCPDVNERGHLSKIYVYV